MAQLEQQLRVAVAQLWRVSEREAQPVSEVTLRLCMDDPMIETDDGETGVVCRAATGVRVRG